MKRECIDAVIKAAGRALTPNELKGIEDRIARNQRMLAQTDKEAYLAMTPAARLQEAAKLAAQEFIADAAKKRDRVALTIQKHDAIDNYMAEQKAKGMNGMESLKRILAFVADGKSNFQSVETRARAIAHDYIRNLVEAFESISPKMLGLFANHEGIRALTYELFGQDSKGIVDAEISGMAKKAAEQWKKTAETARQHFNNAGGQVGRLEDWRMPQQHSQRLVAKAGQEQWLKDTFGKLDRRKYVNEDGSMMDDRQVMEFLNEAWTTIATGGANKIEPGKVTGRGMAANANAEERSIHFKDADSYLEYQSKYGGKDAYTVMMSHIDGLAHDIGLIETLGPNPDLQFKYWLDKSVKEETLAKPTKAGKVQAKASSLQDLYDYIAGKTKPVANQHLSQGFDMLRNWLVATRLGSAFVTSITDNATLHLTAAVNHMSSMQLLRNQLTTLNPANKAELRMARRAGLSLQTLIGEMNRWGTDSIGPSFSSKMANLNIRASLLNAATEARRRAFGVTMYGSIGQTVKSSRSFNAIEFSDRRLLESKGVTPTDFEVWKKADLEDWGNGNDHMLTPDAIYKIPDYQLTKYGDPATLRREAALKLLGMVDEEINMAVVEPGAIERSMTKMGTQRGTWKGEITRSFFLFKSFPIALIMRHWARGFSQGTAGGKAAYITALIAGTTILGAAAQQISQLINGKDPQDMSRGKFWAQALMKGGSLGVYGDFLFNTNSAGGNTPLGTLSGPVAGDIEDLIGLTHGNLIKYAKGQKTTTAADAVQLLKSNIPLQNLWYTKAVTDRLIFNQLQEMVSPGYMSRVEARARRDFGQQYWWKPGSVTPSRAPDFSKAIGE